MACLNIAGKKHLVPILDRIAQPELHQAGQRFGRLHAEHGPASRGNIQAHVLFNKGNVHACHGKGLA
ncbi:MAG: hypothetical protein ACNI3A_02990 [Desulfovibrio sp.]|uniref:hypothetical protein n=1 Tax=Desulfovibrio sp. 7SRBS1 TaxID=3378064 RepID=UPI003B3DF5A2